MHRFIGYGDDKDEDLEAEEMKKLEEEMNVEFVGLLEGLRKQV